MPRSFDSVFYGAAGGGEDLPSDDQFNRVGFLSHFDGANNGVNNAFDDGSTNNHTVTANGNAAQGSFGPFARPDGEWGVDFPINTMLTIPTSADLNLGTGDFTLECFIFVQSTEDNGGIMSKRGAGSFDSSYRLSYRTGTKKVSFAMSGSPEPEVSSPVVEKGIWTHIAVVRDSGTLSIYAAGVQGGTASNNTGDMGGNQPFTIGSQYIDGSSVEFNFVGIISNARFVKGTAVYSGSSFTPPAGKLTAITNTKLLTCQSNRFVDNSASAHALTKTGAPAVTAFGPILTSKVYDAGVNGASAFLDGTGDYLSMDGPGTLNASANWCMECFFYCNDSDPGIARIMSVNEATDADAFTLMRLRNNKYEFYSGGGSDYAYSNQIGTANYQEWTHIALTKSGTTVRAFVNGIKLWEATHNGTNVIAKLITGWGYGSEYFPGYISDARFVNGSSIYTANFTPPTAPLTAITNTSQLLNMADGQAIDSAAQNNLMLDQQAKLSTAQKKFGDSSFVLRGTNTGDIGKCIIEPFGTGNFTVECFVRINDKSDNQGFFQIANGWANSAVKGPALEIRSGRWRWFYGNGGNAWHGSAGPAANDTWYHIAFVRNGTTSTFYADGTAVLTASDSTNYTWGHLAIGVNYDGNYYFGGYIDEFRISRMARYTSNFTPSTEPFADKGQ